MRQVVALGVAAALTLPPTLAAQVTPPFDAGDESGRIEGRVTIPEGTGLADVSVMVVGSRQGTVSDLVGRFALAHVATGPIELRFERLGYASHTVAVDVRPGTVTRVETTLVPQAIELEAIDVRIGVAQLESNGFYRRVRRGFGLQLSREQLDAMHMLEVSDAVRNQSGVLLSYDPYMANRVLATRTRGPRVDGRSCALTVYVDGVRTLDPNINQVPSDWLVGMEVYLGAQTPAQFKEPNNCGAVLLWTKDGR
ncbi:MAG: carboxypeptidase regulatory-like domain-containing protein [Gemmatimonadota bacterium]|jgi:hypothetical protein